MNQKNKVEITESKKKITAGQVAYVYWTTLLVSGIDLSYCSSIRTFVKEQVGFNSAFI